MMMRSVLLLLASCSAAAPRALSVSNDFEIHMRRASRVGEREAVVVDATIAESSKTYTEQVLLKHDEKKFRLHLDAIAETRAVDAFDQPTRVDFAIRAFTKDDVALVAPGKHVVIATAPKKKDAVVEIDGAPASAEMRTLVDEVVPVARREGDADVVFGTRARKRVGDAWPFDRAAVVHELARTGVIAKPDAVSGHVSLAGTTRAGGIDCAVVRIDLAVSAFEPETALPEGSEITRSRVAVRVDELLPLDAHLSRRGDETLVHAEFEAFVPVKGQAEVAGVTVEHVTDRTRRATFAPAP